MTAPRDEFALSADRVTVPETAGWRAQLDLRFVADGAVTRLAHNRHEGPLRLLKALPADDGRALEAIVVHPPGGLAAGDDLSLRLALGAGTRVLATTPGSQKWYRADRPATSGGPATLPSRASTRLQLAAGAVLEWLPQPAILYDRAEACQTVHFELASDACCIGWEMLILGRAAMGERFRSGRIEQTIAIRVAQAPLWRERLVADASDRLFASPLGWDGCTVSASIWCCAPAWTSIRLQALRDEWRQRIEAMTNGAGTSADIGTARAAGGATIPCDGLLLAKLLGDDSEQLQSIALSLWQAARISLDGDAGSQPRIWRT